MRMRHTLLMKLNCVQRLFFESVRLRAGGEQLHPKQGPIVGILLEHEGVGQAELARMLNVSAATVAVSVARLERLGMIQRVRDKRNRRANVLTLTEEGRGKAERMRRTMQCAEEEALRGFTAEELTTLDGLIDRMLDNLKASEPNGKEGTEPRC